MTTFIERWRGRANLLATFGDSVTQALHIADTTLRWSNLLAGLLGARLLNRGLSGTVMQDSPAARGEPLEENGRSRFARDLLGGDRTDVVAILYGSNDARYTAAPKTFGETGFVRCYREVLGGLMEAGYRAEAIVIGSPPHLPAAGFAIGAEAGFAGQSREVFQRYVTHVRDLAVEAGTFYAAVNERMWGRDELILPDHVHPNPMGHAEIAEAFAAARRLG